MCGLKTQELRKVKKKGDFYKDPPFTIQIGIHED
jgi:hypothetical protein